MALKSIAMALTGQQRMRGHGISPQCRHSRGKEEHCRERHRDERHSKGKARTDSNGEARIAKKRQAWALLGRDGNGEEWDAMPRNRTALSRKEDTVKTRPQTESIIAHILAYGSITQLEAFQLYGCFRLASRICDLKKAGYNIGKTMEEGKNRYGEPERHARYFLIK